MIPDLRIFVGKPRVFSNTPTKSEAFCRKVIPDLRIFVGKPRVFSNTPTKSEAFCRKVIPDLRIFVGKPRVFSNTTKSEAFCRKVILDLRIFVGKPRVFSNTPTKSEAFCRKVIPDLRIFVGKPRGFSVLNPQGVKLFAEGSTLENGNGGREEFEPWRSPWRVGSSFPLFVVGRLKKWNWGEVTPKKTPWRVRVSQFPSFCGWKTESIRKCGTRVPTPSPSK